MTGKSNFLCHLFFQGKGSIDRLENLKCVFLIINTMQGHCVDAQKNIQTRLDKCIVCAAAAQCWWHEEQIQNSKLEGAKWHYVTTKCSLRINMMSNLVAYMCVLYESIILLLNMAVFMSRMASNWTKYFLGSARKQYFGLVLNTLWQLNNNFLMHCHEVFIWDGIMFSCVCFRFRSIVFAPFFKDNCRCKWLILFYLYKMLYSSAVVFNFMFRLNLKHCIAL